MRLYNQRVAPKGEQYASKEEKIAVYYANVLRFRYLWATEVRNSEAIRGMH